MKYRMVLTVMILLIAFALCAAQNKQDEGRMLTPGETAERELRGGETHTYKISLKAGEFLHAVIEQRGIDVVVTLIGPDVKKLMEVDSPNGAQGSEPLFWIVEATGEHQLEVRSLEKDAVAGRYEAKVLEVRAPTEIDKKRVAAQQAFLEATNLIGQRTTEARQKRLEKYKEALPLWLETREVERQILTLDSIGSVHSALGERQKALDYYQQALPILRAAGDQSGEAATLRNIGANYAELGEKGKALNYYTQALPILRLVAGRSGVATTLIEIGGLYNSLGKKQKALEYYTEALTIWRAVADRRREAATLNNIGRIYKDLGESQKALEVYNQALPILRAVGDRSAEGVTLNNIGLAYNALGEQQKALDFLNQALPIREASGDLRGEATTLNNIGGVYDELGEKQKALDFYTQALSIFKKAGDSLTEATILNNIGAVYSSLGERRKALEYYNQALPIQKAVDDRRGEAGTLNNIGLVHDILGEKQKALEYYNQALPILKAVGDRRAEAAALHNIGLFYNSLGEKQKALEYYNQALPILKAVGDRRAEATTLNNIGGVYDSLGEKQKALAYYNQALPIRTAVNDRSGEATTLSNIGSVYSDLGENQKALDFYNQALPLHRAVGNRSGEATALVNLGGIYYSQGEYQKALEHYNQALPIKRAVGDRNGEASTLNNIGLAYSELGEKRKALEYYNQALSIHEAVGDRSGAATTLINIGQDYHSLAEYQKALRYYNQALPLMRAVGDRSGEAATLKSIGSAYRALGEKQKALDFYNQALPITRTVGDRRAQAAILNAIGLAYLLLGEEQKALEFFSQALPIQRAVGDRSGEAATLNNLMWLWKGGNASLAVFYGKQSINVYQQLRGNIKGLDKELQTSFLRSAEHSYRTLADLLISQARLPEAQAVLDLLKEEEFSQLVRRSGSKSDTLPYSAAESEAVKLIDDLANIGRQRSELLEKKDKQTLQPSETEQLNRLEEKITTANKELRTALDALVVAEASTKNRVEEVKKEQSLMRDLRELGAGTVALYTVLSGGTMEQMEGSQTAGENFKTGWIILVTPDFRKAYAVDVTNLEKTVFAFREVLRTDKYDPRPLAQQLYRMLFLQTSAQQKTTLAADLEAYLGRAEQKTLMWSLDGVLRYVPMAALHDGQQYLIERYRNVVFNTASLGSLKDTSNKPWTALGLGVTEAREEQGKNFSALTGAERELYAIVREQGAKTGVGILPGVIRLNKDFNKQTMTEGLRAGHPVVHIASHFSFNAANPEQSFLLLGKDHLSVGELLDMSNPFEKVELLTLSACDTAMGSGNGKEVEGFAYTAQSLGAKSVIASLWPVSDDGTDALMTNFYTSRRDNAQLSKGEAFRQAQLSLLRGATKETTRKQTVSAFGSAGRADLAGAESSKSDLPPFQSDPGKPFAHPYYWAPFILIGNWR